MGVLVMTDEMKQEVLKKLEKFPWFRAEPGFKFKWGNSPAMVVGWGGHRKEKLKGYGSLNGSSFQITECEFLGPSLCFVYCYKGEWFMYSVCQCLRDEKSLDFLPWSEQ